MKKVILTGFMPFGGETINPSYEAIRKLDLKNLNIELMKLEVPTDYRNSTAFVLHHIEQFKPDIIIMVGQAGGRKEINLERIAINIDDSISPDNLGEVRIDQAIDPQGVTAYFSTLPIRKIADQIKASGIPVGISNTAGAYICNHLMYGVLQRLDLQRPNGVKAGFIHVPYIKEQVSDKNNVFALDDIIKALTIAVNASLEV
jgi:pyroglutamyl-peptidase